MISQVAAAITTILLYVPLLDDFFRNMQKVRMVVVDRTPFLLKLINTIFPGILTVHGAVVYGVLLAAGMLFIFKKDKRLCLFIIITMVVPLTLLLSLNPMFVYERYFLYALPFALLVLGCGICQIVGLVKKRLIFQILFILLIVTDLAVLQFPLIKEMNLQDRQNYREAVRYVENTKSNDSKQTYVFTLGYAGVHFNYYAKETVYIPATYEEFKERIKGKKYLWCLLTAWLPELRPPHEDVEFYKEQPEHVKIYNYVQKHFELNKTYSDKYLTKVYFRRCD
jgi:hypothetical protein